MILASSLTQVPIGDGTWAWILGAAGVAVILNQVMQVFSHFRPKPPYAEQFTPKKEFDALVLKIDAAITHNSERHSQLFERIEHVEEKWRGEMLAATKEIQVTLSSMATSIGTLNERTTRTNETIKDVSERLAVLESDVANLAGRQGLGNK